MYYSLLFLWCFAAASIIPVACEPYFTLFIVEKQIWILPLIVATVGNTLGSVTTFLLARKATDLTLHRMSEKNKGRYEKVQTMLQKHGPIVLILAWIFILGDVLVAVAGALRCNIWKSIFWLAIGKLLRFSIITYLTLQITS